MGNRGLFTVQLKSWRVTLLALMDSICNEPTRPPVASCAELTHVYQFGVYTGRSLKGMVQHGSFSPRVHAFWGFDSFSGMPDELLAADRRESKLAEAFPKGMFDVGAVVSAGTTPAQAVRAFVNDTRTTLISGFPPKKIASDSQPPLSRHQRRFTSSNNVFVF